MNASQLKLFMMGMMVLDHIDYFIPVKYALFFHVITRCVGVFFGYMAVEGFRYTKSIYRYNGRLYLWALIMMMGNYIMNLILRNPMVIVYNNIFLTLALGVSLLMITKYFRENKQLKMRIICFIGIVGLLLIGGVVSEGGMIILPFMLITFLTENQKGLRNSLYVLFSIVLFINSYQWMDNWGTTIEMLALNSDFMFILVVPVLCIYNGERGNNSPFYKHLFYFFYPAHLWGIALLASYSK